MNPESKAVAANILDHSTSLDRLHDVSVPPEISWWPPAPGWYVVLAILGMGLCLLTWRSFLKYRSNAYRRIALRELQLMQDHASVAELLRRTALAVAPRQLIANLTGEQWLDWLSSQCSDPIPDSVKSMLIDGPYRITAVPAETDSLKRYAARWIAQHQISVSEDQVTKC